MIYEENIQKIIKYNVWARENGHDSRLGVNANCDCHPDEFGKQTIHTINRILNPVNAPTLDLDTFYSRHKRDIAAPSTWGIEYAVCISVRI